MKFRIFVIFTALITLPLKATILKDSIATDQDSKSNWTNKNDIHLIFTQNSFVNWSAGGNNSVSGILKVRFVRNYKNSHLSWTNEIKSNYGLNKEEKRELRKTEDLVEINSTFGYRDNTTSNWYYSAKFNFKTQFTNGYKYPNTDKPISKFFSPAYLFLGVGSEYSSKQNNLKIYLSPITNKTTFVYDQTLANEGAFGVDPAVYDENENLLEEGENTKIEFGTLIAGEWQTDVMKNITMANKLSLYSDYLHDYGNVDVNWEVNFDLTINKYVKANVGAQMLFDDDDLYKEDIDNDGELDILGPKIQLKQLLGVGFAYSF
ncbi:DUF3078 domain-containing protein [Lutibacter sp. B1]|uniref:DUF3078 domain-containing protein n=1 Tax=Lutibacter sp. B1 TaxID=2725996 RepID=UPI00145686AB|nr:DUF3078 domain-containing protein [Lutibacter sp. B1]NLP57266.1 DUF3078 domain-containing protein [Lutibacter sp. B1]